MKNTVFTIGHSTHDIEKFIDLLKMHHITAICDVRSSPYSKFNPQYNRENLKSTLKSKDIQYVFLGKELGARSDNPKCYHAGKVQYDLLAKTELFQSGLERVIQGAKDFKIALVCAEKDPIECHRTILVSRALEKRGCSIAHILEDGKIETHDELTTRLIKTFSGGQDQDFFMTEEDVCRHAYSKQAEKISYIIPVGNDDRYLTDIKVVR